MIKIKRPPNNNDFLEKNDADFMKDSHNRDKAFVMLRMRAQRRKAKGMTREEFIDYARRRGFLKTEKDRQIVEDIIKKENLPHDKFYHRKPKRVRKLMGRGTEQDKRELEQLEKEGRLKEV